ncbi:DUF3718 domain-containing protein [Rheinheimera maricola]|uniref:DUF3718 domain-containing protein n=1 Tax=Rheinheimera maricola TaxID=2793282 RepID=A0ABS7X3J5_9GAMM|nr:DUF3718 domain-containing protein [Rheinheimera maricola]MBZ9610129.1 DUF3718 domain-containing protein [Rheinheimera maricola]
MKKQAWLTVAVVISLTFPAIVSANYSENYIRSAVVEICTETATDDRLGLKKTLGHFRISKQNAVEKVVCNGQQLMAFARANQAVKVTAMLKPYEDRIKGRVTIQDVTSAPN